MLRQQLHLFAGLMISGKQARQLIGSRQAPVIVTSGYQLLAVLTRPPLAHHHIVDGKGVVVPVLIPGAAIVVDADPVGLATGQRAEEGERPRRQFGLMATQAKIGLGIHHLHRHPEGATPRA
ncbi:hypothetical protein D3C72_727620 [compost metagenome]